MPIYNEGQVETNSKGEEFRMEGGKWTPLGKPALKIPTAPTIAAPSDPTAAPGKIPSDETGLTGTLDTVTGIGKAAGSELVHGVVPSVLGLPGDVQDIVGKGADWVGNKAAEKLGLPTKPIPQTSLKLPGSEAIRGVTTKLAPEHEPQNAAEEYAASIAGFLPMTALAPGGMGVQNIIRGLSGAGTGALKQGGKEMASALTRFGVAPGVTSETAGRVAPEGYELPARIAGGLMAPGVARWLMSPNAVKGATSQSAKEYKAAVDNLRDEHGIGKTLMPSQVTNDRVAAANEKMLANTKGSGTESRFLDELNHRALTDRAFRYAGAKGERGTPDVIEKMEDNASKAFSDLTSDKRLVVPFTVTGVTNNQSRAVNKIVSDYEATAGPKPSKKLGQWVSRIEKIASDNKGVNKDFLTSEQYQSLRSQLGKASDTTENVGLRRAYGKLQSLLDDNMASVIKKYFPDRAGKFEEAREQWKNHLVVKDAVDPVTKLVTPDKLASAVERVTGSHGALRETNPLARLANSAAMVMKPIESAGSPSDPFRHNLTLASVLAGTSIGASGGASHGGPFEGLAGGAGGAALGALLPKLGAKAAFARPFMHKGTVPSQALFQQYRANQLAPKVPLSQNKAQQLMIMRALAEGGRGGEAPIE